MAAGTGLAQVGGRGAGGFRAGGRVGTGRRVGQVGQREAQPVGVADLGGQAGGLPVIRGRLGHPPGGGVVDPAGGEQVGESGVVDGQILAEGQGLGG